MNALLVGSTGAALALLAMGMPRHFKHVFRKNSVEETRRGLRLAGWLFLVISLLAALLPWEGGTNLAAWIALLAFHGVLIGLILAYRPRWIPAWAGSTIGLGFVACAMRLFS